MSDKYETFEALKNWQPSKQPKYDDTELRTFLNNLCKDEDDIIDTTPKPAPKPKAKPKPKQQAAKAPKPACDLTAEKKLLEAVRDTTKDKNVKNMVNWVVKQIKAMEEDNEKL